MIFDKFIKFPFSCREECIDGAKRKVGGKKCGAVNVQNLDFRVEGISSRVLDYNFIGDFVDRDGDLVSEKKWARGGFVNEKRGHTRRLPSLLFLFFFFFARFLPETNILDLIRAWLVSLRTRLTRYRPPSH